MGTDTDPTPALADRLVTATVGALELFGVYLGTRLGLYDAVAGSPGLTPPDLAKAAGIAPRYAREWLEQQAVAGLLEVEGQGDGADPDERRYTLPTDHAGALLDPTAADHVAPLAGMLVGIANALDRVVDAYRTGGGVPYSCYGADFRDGQGAINRPIFTTGLVDEWLPATRVADRLTAGGRVLDLGTGQGWSAIAVARAFPATEVWAIDNDPASIDDARRNAAEAGVAVRAECADAAEAAATGGFDVVLLLECLHDMARPTEVLGAARAALADGGSVLVADEAVAPTFTAPGDELERFMYGWSISHCLPASMTEQPSAAIGTAIREPTIRALAADAGFESVDVLDVDGGFFRIYELR